MAKNGQFSPRVGSSKKVIPETYVISAGIKIPELLEFL